jgi:DNA-binding NtrC family response regulator
MNGNALAVSQCVQALRVVAATGEASTLVELVEQLIRLMSLRSEYGNVSPDSKADSPPWRPTSIVCHLDRLSRLLPRAASDGSDLITFLGSIADLTANPLALGEEALRCMASMAWINSGSVVQIVDGEGRTVVSFDSDVEKRRSEAATDNIQPEHIQVWIGTKQARRYELNLSPHESGQATAACYGLAQLLALLRGASDSDVREPKSDSSDQGMLQADDREGLFRSPAMLALLASAKRVAPLGITVLLTGESGTGKEIVANIIHRASGAPQDAFVAFNCATVPRDMVDSQLFGYRRGAFTGAAQGFMGVFSAADGGTLLLDEVGELPPETQPKLLRFLDSGEVQALGEATPRKLRVRVIAATNADLEGLVQAGRFREDLYYRLNVVRFRLPPLRERREEILPLVSLFLAKYSSEFGKHSVRLSDAATEHLLLYSWPGNVRQLSHEVRRIVALSDSDSVIDVRDLDTPLRGTPERAFRPPVPGARCVTVRIDRTLSEAIRQVEDAAIADAVEAAEGRLDLAARRLGISRKGLYLKRRRLGIL